MKKLIFSLLLFSLTLPALAQAGMWVGVKNIHVEKKSKKVVFTVTGEYPFSEDSVTADAIREWINESLGGTYTGNLTDYNAMLQYYADRTIESYADAEVDEDFGPSEESYTFKRGHETGNIITYQLKEYSYPSGAAHGMDIDYSVTFRKKDGLRFNWDMFTGDGLTRLRPVIAKKLRVDYGDDTFFKVPRAEDPEFSLPEMQPFFTAGGVVFVYQPYEIAPYAAGPIEVTLPFTMVKGMLNATGQTFISAL